MLPEKGAQARDGGIRADVYGMFTGMEEMRMKHRGILIAILFVLLFSVSALAEDTENTENTENTESVYMLPAELKRIAGEAVRP